MNRFSSSRYQAKRRLGYLRFALFLGVLIVLCVLNAGGKTDLGLEDASPASGDTAESVFRVRSILAAKESDEESAEEPETAKQHHSTGKQHAVTAAAAANKSSEPTCVRPDIEQFPKGIFSRSARLHGAVIFHFLVAAYMFLALAIVCDDYFVPALDIICKRLNLKEDVAGATFMAAGSSAPELATTIISLFIAKDVDIGIGTVVGSAVFNIMFVISIVALFSGMVISLNWYPMMRDSVCYLVSILAMILIIMDEKVYWYEAISFLLLYGGYIAVMIFNPQIEAWCLARFSFIDNRLKEGTIEIEGGNYSTLENETNLNMNQLNSSNSLSADAQSQHMQHRDATDGDLKNLASSSAAKSGEEEAFSPSRFPDAGETPLNKIKFYVSYPLNSLLYFTVPDSRNPERQSIFMVTFAMSLVWLCIFSYIMVWMITIIGYTFLIPDTVMGITLIAFGASVPDALSSLLVAKNGQGDMAVSNAIGSNVFDILICLGIPWLFSCLTIDKADHISVKSKGLTYSSITLFGTVIILVASIRYNRWQLDKRIGVFLMVVYLAFILLTSLYELNIIGSNHLPMCTDSNW